MVLGDEDTSRDVDQGEVIREAWKRELDIVKKAGERHPRNYYAWEYARQLFHILYPPICGSGSISTARDHSQIMRDSLAEVHMWCLMHPRDISGWSFLAFLSEEARGETHSCEEAIDNQRHLQDEITRVIWRTREWVRKYEWRGESVEWFLKVVERVGHRTTIR